MKKLVLRIIMPFTLIAFLVFTKWWYALPVDGPDTRFWGFPFAFVGEGWHTSMSLQFFVLEFFADFLVYLLCCAVVIGAIDRWKPGLVIHKATIRIAWSLATLFMLGAAVVVCVSNPIFHLKRPYDWQVMTSGYVFIWQVTPSPDIYQYHPEKKLHLSNP